MDPKVHKILQRGVVIPAMPLALDSSRRLDERRQRGLCRYYFAAGAGGLAVGVHTTQFAIREPKVGLFEPVLALAAEEFARADRGRIEPLVRVAGVVGLTAQAVAEAELARGLGYHAGLLSLAALKGTNDAELIAHCNAVASVIPVVGFYLQPVVGGRVLSYSFWRQFVEIKNVVAIKMAPFNRYQTIDVVRAVAEAGRGDIALYTGNDDNIVMDLLTPYHFGVGSGTTERRIVGGLLGQWAVWTKKAVELLEFCHGVVKKDPLPGVVLRTSVQLTDANAAIFDAANAFHGCIPGIHEVLRRQGLLENLVTLDERETLSPGQAEQIDRVCRAYPHLNDDAFVQKHRDEWLRG
jgi:dihydrodipicolinate synthetase family protein